ncbi:MAG: TolC family protein [Leptothrix sp. (in: b-proteobacteria)]
MATLDPAAERLEVTQPAQPVADLTPQPTVIDQAPAVPSELDRAHARGLACLEVEAATQALNWLQPLAALETERVERLQRRIDLRLAAAAELAPAHAARVTADLALADGQSRLAEAQARREVLGPTGVATAMPRSPGCGFERPPSLPALATPLTDDVREAWRSADLAERQLAAAQAVQFRVQQQRAAADARLRLGLVSAFDHLDAQAALLQAQLDTAHAREAVELAFAAVRLANRIDAPTGATR